MSNDSEDLRRRIDPDAAAREAKDEINGELTDLSQQIANYMTDRRKLLFDECMELLKILEPISEYELPIRDMQEELRRDALYRESGRGQMQPAEKHEHLKIKSQQLQIDVFNQAKYKPLGFQRVRCYVQTSKTGAVREYDVIVPEWNGDLMFDPRMTWKGPESEGTWLGFRPASGPKNVRVLSPSTRSYTRKDQMVGYDGKPETAEHGVKVLGIGKRGPENYHWKVVDKRRWETSHETDEGNIDLFIRHILEIRDDIRVAQLRHLASLQDQNANLRGKKYLPALGSADGAAEPERAETPQAGDRPAPASKPQTGRGGRQAPQDLDLT